MAQTSSPRSSALAALTRPGHRRIVALRYLLASVLTLCAGVIALQSATEHPHVVVFTRDVPAGTELSAGDVELRRVPESFVPPQALTTIEGVEGSVTVAAAGAGEIVTPSRTLAPGLAHALVSNTIAGEDSPSAHSSARLVPISLANADIIPLLHHGDTVDVLSHESEVKEDDSSPPDAAVIAAGGKVVTTHLKAKDAGSRSPATILLAMDREAAHRVASASLTRPLTVVITGDRASVSAGARAF